MSAALRLHSAPAGRVFKAESSHGLRVARGFITLEERDEQGQPVRDYDGDYVIASGGTCEGTPVVNWDHGIVIGKGDQPVLKAVDDGGQLVSGLVGTSYLASKAADLAGVDLSRRNEKGRVVGRWNVADCLYAAEDLWPLIRDQVATGLSMEFSGLQVERGRKSHVSGRQQSVYHRYVIHGWAHTPRPINRMAQLFEDEVEQAEKAFRDVAERGKSELVRKSLTAFLGALPKGAVAVPVTPVRRSKAMGPLVDDPPVDAPADAALPGDTLPVDEPADDTPPTARAAYDVAQGAEDLAAMIEDAVKMSEHMKGKKQLLKLAELLRGHSGKANEIAEMVMGEVGTEGPDDDSDPDDDSGADDPDDETVPKSFAPLEKASDGSLVLKSGYRAKRFRQFKASELRDPVPDGSVVYTADEHEALTAGIDQLKKLLPKSRTP